ncbi:hypothetical protein F5880DRAFT_1129827 [Lentinula raphanica]|nr:hypothetical protein F5880DRAFT_1129827 [Lentinula raphanica]
MRRQRSTLISLMNRGTVLIFSWYLYVRWFLLNILNAYLVSYRIGRSVIGRCHYLRGADSASAIGKIQISFSVHLSLKRLPPVFAQWKHFSHSTDSYHQYDFLSYRRKSLGDWSMDYGSQSSLSRYLSYCLLSWLNNDYVNTCPSSQVHLKNVLFMSVNLFVLSSVCCTQYLAQLPHTAYQRFRSPSSRTTNFGVLDNVERRAACQIEKGDH